MFCSNMKDKIFGELDTTLIVTHSHINGVACVPKNLVSSPNLHSHVVYLTPSTRHMYSTSIDWRAIVGCRFEHQVMSELPNVNTYPPMDFLVFPSPAQSDSVKPLRSFCSFFQYIMPKSKVPLKYFKFV